MLIIPILACNICHNEFDMETRKPCIGTCEHLICESCKDQMSTPKCQECNQEDAFAITITNYHVMEMMRDLISSQVREVEDEDQLLEVMSPLTFTDSDPILITDRKRGAHEPVIGIFNPSTAMWLDLGRMPNRKSNYAVASTKDKIYIVGGRTRGDWLNSLEVYDKDSDKRRNLANMKQGRTRPSAGFHNGKLFVAGGYNGDYMSSVEVFDLETGRWKDGPRLQKARADAAVVSCNGELYVLGGYNGKDYIESIEHLTETSEGPKFEVIGDMQGSRAGFGACAFKGRIYVAGGWSNSSNTLKSVRSFDPLTKTWRDEPSLNKDRKYFTLHATNEAIYAVRGCVDSWERIEEVERLDEENQRWEILERYH